MCRTIMFNSDRFSKDQDYEHTYRTFGGKYLNNKILHEIIHYTYGTLLERNRDAKYIDEMMTVDELIFNDEYFSSFSRWDKQLIERVFAHHECGVVPESCRQTLEVLSKTHRLGLISNVWCKSEYFIMQLKRDSVYSLFELHVFSSDHKTAKPSKKIFEIAINHFACKPENMVYIGDNYKRDVVGSKNAGMISILINNSESSKITGSIVPDLVVSGIESLI